MAVDLFQLPAEQPMPADAPSRWFWTATFVALTLFVASAVVLTWPKDEPTQSIWFLFCLTIFPAGVAALVVLRRYSIYEGHRLNAQAWNEARARHIENVFEQASVPVAVLGAVYSYIDDAMLDRADAIAEGTLVLKAQPAIARQGATTARWFSPNNLDQSAWQTGLDSLRQIQVLAWLIDRLLQRSNQSLMALPDDLPLTVRLSVSAKAFEGDIEALWRDRWRRQKLRRATLIVESEDPGSMSIDAWLDSDDAQVRMGATLQVAIQLNGILGEDTLDGSAEAGVALLLIHRDLLQQYGMKPVAYVHRPVQGSKAELSHVFTYALKWGKTEPAAVGRVWSSTVNESDVAAIPMSLRDAGITKHSGQNSEPPPELNMDRTVGRAGIAADWLTIACAAATAGQFAQPQLLIMQRGSDFVSAVVASPEHR